MTHTHIERALCCGATCGRTRPEHGECVAATHGRAQHERLKAAGYRVVTLPLASALMRNKYQEAQRTFLLRQDAKAMRQALEFIAADTSLFNFQRTAVTNLLGRLSTQSRANG